MIQSLHSRSFFSAALLSLGLVGGFVATGNAAEKAPPGRDGKAREHFVNWMRKELNLSPTQTAQVREILRPEDTLVQPPEHLTEEGRGKGPQGRGPGLPMFNEEFIDQLKSDKVDTAALNMSLAERQARMQAQHHKMVFKFVQFHAVLTPAQRLKLADILETRRAEQRDRVEKKSIKK